MISFLSILLWNAERPRYPSILFSDRIYGIAGMFFLFFHLDKDCVGNWLQVASTSG